MNDDVYTYPGSGGVLRNLLDIRAAADLEDAEVSLVAIAWSDLRLAGDPALDMLCRIHKEMFGNLYGWAGRWRTTNVTAAGTGNAYALKESVVPGLTELFANLEQDNFLRGHDQFDFLEGLDTFWGQLTHLHPFRDGNTRSQAAFVAYLAKHAGHPIDWAAVDPERLQRARISVACGHPHKIAWYLEGKMLGLDADLSLTGQEPWHTRGMRSAEDFTERFDP